MPQNFTIGLTLLLFVIPLYLYYYFTKTFNHWRDKGVKYEEPIPFFGNAKDLLLRRENAAQGTQRLYNKFPDEPYIGFFLSRKPMLLVKDRDLIKQILVKDFQHFPDRGIVNNENSDPLSENLFNMRGEKWKDLRQKLTPVFSSGKIKSMFASLVECGEEFNSHLNEIARKQNVFEMVELSGAYTAQVIGSCVFGVNTDTMKDFKYEFIRMGKKVFEQSLVNSIKTNIRAIFPDLFRILRMKITQSQVENFFLTFAKDMVNHRTKYEIKRADFLQLLINLKESGGLNINKELKFKMDDNLLAAQMYVFLVAGFETSSATMSFCLYELALNLEVQERMQKEIDETLRRHDGKLTYEGILEMEYLDQVISETLRKHSPASNLMRKCDIPYIIPGTQVHLDDNDIIMIPVHALHHDPKHFPSPHKFDPERFSKKNKESRHQFCYLPFGEGPRMCIGVRFAKFQSMVGLISTLRDFSVSPCAKTDIPIIYSESDLITKAKNGIWLELKRRII